MLFLRIFLFIAELIAGLIFYCVYGSGYDIGFKQGIMAGIFLFLLMPITLKFGKIDNKITGLYLVLAIVFTVFYSSHIYSFREAEFKEKLNHDVNLISVTLSKGEPVGLIAKSENIRHNLQVMDLYYDYEYKNETCSVRTKKNCAFDDILVKNQDAKYMYAYVDALYYINESIKDEPSYKKAIEEYEINKAITEADTRTVLKALHLASKNTDTRVHVNYQEINDIYNASKKQYMEFAKERLQYIPKTWDNELSPKVEEVKAYLE